MPLQLPELTSQYMRAGWVRWIPQEALFLHQIVIGMEEEGLVGEPDEQDPDHPLSQYLDCIGGLSTEPFGVYREQVEADPDDPEAIELFRNARARAARATSSVGMDDLRTNRDVLELLRRLDVVERREEEGDVTWRPVDPVPLPEERLPLTEAERLEEDRIRWRDLHYASSQELIRLFVKKDVTVVSGSLQGLGHELDLETEDVREGIAVLLADGDFVISGNLGRLTPEEQFELRVDWDQFNEKRITFRLTDPDEQPADETAE